MSLKSFHLFFISISMLFTVGFAFWFLLEEPFQAAALNVFSALLSFSFCGGLALYGVRFLKKFKNLHFM